MINIPIVPVVTPDYTQVHFLAIQAVNLGVADDNPAYGQAQYQIFDADNNLLLGNTCSFTKQESDEHWNTDEEFATWLTINKLNYTPTT